MKPEERKREIIEAAIELFATKGYHATSISDIIDGANIARGTFYLYFKSKHEIFQSILDDFIMHIRSQIKSIELDSSHSPATQMRKNVERTVDAILERPEVGKILFNEAVGLDEETQTRLKNFYQSFITIIEHSIKRGISLGLLRNIDLKVASCIALGSVREIIMQTHIFKNAKIGRDKIVDGIIDILFGGLGEKLI